MPDERTCTIGATRQDPDVRLPKHWLLEWLTYVVVRLSVCVIQTLHIDTVAWLARGLALVVHDVFRIRVRVTEENIAHAFPRLCREEQHRMARQMWEHMVVMVAEIAQASRKIHDTNWRNHLEMSPEVRRQFVSRLLDPRPLIVVTGHHGNFEIGGLGLGLSKCWKIVELHGGQVNAEATGHTGATFKIQFPATLIVCPSIPSAG